MNLELFISEIKKIKDIYNKERSKDRFNIFYALHKEHDEVNLHSRFISYLLAKDSGHNKNDFFAKIFFEIAFENKIDKKFLDGYEVFPNEFNKTEFKEIDILLINRKLSHAIIIENKIYAKDSNHSDKKVGYDGQLERYYNTIEKGIPFDNTKNSKDDKYIKHEYISKNIDVFYLALNPSKEESFKLSKGNIPKNIGVTELFYKDKIVKWLETCIRELKEEDFLKKIINQYLILVKNMTKTNIPIQELNDLRQIYSKNLETTQYIIDNFKHIKWHTVSRFLNHLKEKLIEKGYSDVVLYPENTDERDKSITDLTHHNKNINIGVLFKNDDKERLYISVFNNLSWGISNSEKWWEFKNNKLENIRFSDFSTDNTYQLIDETKMENAVEKIIDEIII